MMRHTVTEKELDDWREERWFQFAASFGDCSHKKLEANLKGIFRVTDHDKVLYIGGRPLSAVQEYNLAP